MGVMGFLLRPTCWPWARNAGRKPNRETPRPPYYDARERAEVVVAAFWGTTPEQLRAAIEGEIRLAEEVVEHALVGAELDRRCAARDRECQLRHEKRVAELEQRAAALLQTIELTERITAEDELAKLTSMLVNVLCLNCYASNVDPGNPNLEGFRCGRCGGGLLVRIPQQQAPLPPTELTLISSAVGAALGAAFGGPVGAFTGGALGAFLMWLANRKEQAQQQGGPYG